MASAVSSVFEAVTGLASVAGSLDSDLKVERAKVAGKEEQVKALDKRLAAEIAQVKKLRGDLAAERVRVKKLTAKLAAQQKVVASVSRKVTKRTAAGATRNVAATFGEAIPVIGVGVVVAATAWELKDACDTMKDLHELEVALDPTKAKDASVQEVCGLRVPTKEEIWDLVKSSPGAAWQRAKDVMPELPEMPDFTMPEMPSIDWKFWD